MLVFAASRDKDVPGMLRVLAPHFERIVLTQFQENPRAVPPEQLAVWCRAELASLGRTPDANHLQAAPNARRSVGAGTSVGRRRRAHLHRRLGVHCGRAAPLVAADAAVDSAAPEPQSPAENQASGEQREHGKSFRGRAA